MVESRESARACCLFALGASSCTSSKAGKLADHAWCREACRRQGGSTAWVCHATHCELHDFEAQ